MYIPNRPSVTDNSWWTKGWFQILWTWIRGFSAVASVQTANFTLTDRYFYPCDTTANPVTATLPPAAGIEGRQFLVNWINGGNALVVQRSGTDAVWAAATGTNYTFTFLGESVAFISDGVSTWYVS